MDHGTLARRLPHGTYLLNNGPKAKGGRFFTGTHEEVKQLFADQPHVRFTDNPIHADYVLLPAGIREPGNKVVKRNPSLTRPEAVFSMEDVIPGSILRSESYSSRKNKKNKKKHAGAREKRHKKMAMQYVRTDAKTGKKTTLSVPSQLDPHGHAKFLNPNYIKQLEEVKDIPIDQADYVASRRQLRTDYVDVVHDTRLDPTPPPQPSHEDSLAWTAPPAAQNARLHNMMSRINNILDEVDVNGGAPPLKTPPDYKRLNGWDFSDTDQKGSFPPMNVNPNGIVTTGLTEHELLKHVGSNKTYNAGSASAQLGQTQSQRASDDMSRTQETAALRAQSVPSPEDEEMPKIEAQSLIKEYFDDYNTMYNETRKMTADLNNETARKQLSQDRTAPDKGNLFMSILIAMKRLYQIIWNPLIYNIQSAFANDFDKLQSQNSKEEQIPFNTFIDKMLDKQRQSATQNTWGNPGTDLPTVQNQAYFLQEFDLDTATKMIGYLIKMAVILEHTIEEIDKYLKSYRIYLRESMSRDKLSLQCWDLGEICVNYENPENSKETKLGGEPMYYLIRGLFAMSCDMFNNIENLRNTDDWKTLCTRVDGISASANDMHTYLLYRGAMTQQIPSFDASLLGESFCATTNQMLDRATTQMEELDMVDQHIEKNESKDFLNHTLYTWNLREFLYYLRTVDDSPDEKEEEDKDNGSPKEQFKGRIYNQFVAFLLRGNQQEVEAYLKNPDGDPLQKDRANLFADLQTSVSNMSSKHHKRLWLSMYFVAMTFVMANLCQDVTNMDFQAISRLLYTAYEPDHPKNWVIGSQQRGKLKNLFSMLGFVRRRWG